MLKRTLKHSQPIHVPSFELYNELQRQPQQAEHHFRLAMELSKQEIAERRSTPSNTKLQDRIRFHLERCVSSDPTFIQAHYNLALLDYRQNALHQTRRRLNQVLALQPNHFKANLMLCDLLLEDGDSSDLFEAVHCYTKLLNAADLNQNPRNLHKSKDKINSSDLSVSSYGSKASSSNDSPNNEPTKKVFALARHNLCSVLDLINGQMINNSTMKISSNFCTRNAPPIDSFIQQIHYQVPITST